ncbi:hypothetical protein B5P43_27575 [Bacillus sp. SRB_336]|nr:hypothetical protein B5P43_27575 [Bacillus sp. SRB_336]
MVILFVTGVFHLYRGVPVDALVFLSAGAALAIDTAVRHAGQAGQRQPAAQAGQHQTAAQAGQHQPAAQTEGERVDHVQAGSSTKAPAPARTQPPAPAPARTPAPAPAPARMPAHSPAPVVRAPRALPRWLWAAAAAAVGALSLAVVVLAPESSTGIPAVVGLVGAAMLLVAWPNPPRPPGRPGPRVRRAAYGWAGVVLFLCIWELGTYFIDRFSPGGEAVFPPLTDLLQPLFDSDSSRWIMTALWLVACGSLLRVVRRP